MSSTAFHSLVDVNKALAAQLGTHGQSALGSVGTRVLLRTGASLKNPRPDQNADPAVIAKVLAALADMGHPL